MSERRWLWLIGALTALGGLWAAWLVFGPSEPPASNPRPGVAADPRGEKAPGVVSGVGASTPRAPVEGGSAARPATISGSVDGAERNPLPSQPVAAVPLDPDAELARQALLSDLRACVDARRAKGARAKGDLDLDFLVVRRGGYGRARAPSVVADGIADSALTRCAVEQVADADFPVLGDGDDLAVRVRLHVNEDEVTLRVLGTAAPEDVSEAAASPATVDTPTADGATEASPVTDAGTEGSR